MKTILTIAFMVAASPLSASGPDTPGPKDCVPAFFKQLPTAEDWYYGVGTGVSAEAARKSGVNDLALRAAGDSSNTKAVAGWEQNKYVECEIIKNVKADFVLLRIQKADVAQNLARLHLDNMGALDDIKSTLAAQTAAISKLASDGRTVVQQFTREISPVTILQVGLSDKDTSDLAYKEVLAHLKALERSQANRLVIGSNQAQIGSYRPITGSNSQQNPLSQYSSLYGRFMTNPQ